MNGISLFDRTPSLSPAWGEGLSHGSDVSYISSRVAPSYNIVIDFCFSLCELLTAGYTSLCTCVGGTYMIDQKCIQQFDEKS